MLLINWYPSSLLCHHLHIQLCTRELKTICRLKFNVDSAGSIQTLPLTVMEARIYKRDRGLSQPLLCFTPLCYDRATNGGLLNIRCLLIDQQQRKTNAIFFLLRIRIFILDYQFSKRFQIRSEKNLGRYELC